MTNILRSRFSVLVSMYYFNIATSVWYLTIHDFTFNSLLVVAIIFFLMNPIGIAITYHRYWSHKAFVFRHKILEFLCTLPPMISGVGSIVGWVGMHRAHHKHSDQEKDPHLAAKGFWNMLLMNSYDYNPNPRDVVDLMRNKFAVTTHNYYFAIPLLYAVLCFVFYGIDGLVLGFCMPSALSLITQNTTNYVNHKEDNSFTPTNVNWINLFNFGDGYHKNHHNNPRRYTTSEKWYQPDLAGILIKYIFAKEIVT